MGNIGENRRNVAPKTLEDFSGGGRGDEVNLKKIAAQRVEEESG